MRTIAVSHDGSDDMVKSAELCASSAPAARAHSVSLLAGFRRPPAFRFSPPAAGTAASLRRRRGANRAGTALLPVACCHPRPVHPDAVPLLVPGCRVRASLNAQAGSTGAWRVFPMDIAFDVAVQRADVVIVLLTAEWSASASGRADLNSTQGLRLSAHEADRVNPWQAGSPIVIVVGFKGVDWSSGSVKQLVDINPTVMHDAESLCLGAVADSLFLLWQLVNQI